MTTAAPSISTQQKAWAKAIAQPAQEFPLTPLSVISGQPFPPTCRQPYRNGPGRLERQGQRVSHWFDGDGAVLAVHFAEGQAQAPTATSALPDSPKKNRLSSFSTAATAAWHRDRFGSAGMRNSKMRATPRCSPCPTSCWPCGKAAGPINWICIRWKRKACIPWGNWRTMSPIPPIPSAIPRPDISSTLGSLRGPTPRSIFTAAMPRATLRKRSRCP
jgi:hypothetical protein